MAGLKNPNRAVAGSDPIDTLSNGVKGVGFGPTVDDDGQTVVSGGHLAARGGFRRTVTSTTCTTAGAETYTAAELLTGIYRRDPNGAARTDTTDTGTNIETAMAAKGAVVNGDAFEVYLINDADAAEAITLAGGTGVTIANVGQTIAQNEAALLVFIRTAPNTFTLLVIGA